jgi:hypothetical protein
MVISIRLGNRRRKTSANRQSGWSKEFGQSWTLMDVSKEVLAGAGRTFPVEPVRTLDAIPLATALLFMQAFPDLTTLTFDQRIEVNAQALGIG